MTMMRLSGALAVCLALLAAPARGQPLAGAIASGSVAAAVVDAGTDPSVAGSLGYRFNRVIGLGVELSWTQLKVDIPSSAAAPYSSVIISDPDAKALFFTTNVRIEIPTVSKRVLPFAVGGGGVASTTTRYTITSRPLFQPGITIPSQQTGLVTIPTIVPTQSRPENTSTGLALTLGGGVSFLVTDHVSFDVDLRSVYIRGNPGGSIGRFGVGTSYRF